MLEQPSSRHAVSLNMFTIVLGFVLLAFIGFDSAMWFFIGRSTHPTAQLPQLPAATEADKKRILDSLAVAISGSATSSTSTAPATTKQLSTQNKLKLLDALANVK